MKDKRRYKRKKIVIDVEMDISRNQKWLDATTTNISEGGMCLVSRRPLELGATMNLKFYVPDTERVINTLGKLMWIEKMDAPGDGYYNGIEFVNIYKEDRDLIAKYVENTTFDTK